MAKSYSSLVRQWNFEVDYNDHFETPFMAYSDIDNYLKLVSQSLNKLPQDLVIYDPYYCQGKMLQHLQRLGYLNVINKNSDFYEDISSGSIPGKNFASISTIACVHSLLL